MGLQAGVMQRVATGRDPGAPSPEPGPVAELDAHVAVLPLLRIGPYLGYGITPLSKAVPLRQDAAAGLRAKLTPPILPLPWRTWAFAGVGYAVTYERSHVAPLPFQQGGSTVQVAPGTEVPGQGGGSLEGRLGVGLGYRLGRPWELFAELGARVGLVFFGSVYDRGACGCDAAFAGKDSFALSLTLGLSLNQ
jgi:hypothetical protein